MSPAEHTGRPPTLSERKREDILAAAIECFQSQGFDATSMDRIAEVAGVSKRTVYNHFNSKEALFEQINNSMHQELMAVGNLPYEPLASLEEQLLSIARQEAELITSPRFIALARCALTTYFRCQDLANEAWQRLQKTEKGIERWLRAADQDGRMSVPDTRVAARQFSALLKEFLFWPQVLLGAEPLPAKQVENVVMQTVEVMLARYAN